MKEKILIIGALGQIGSELTASLREHYGEKNVIASDIVEKRNLRHPRGIYEHLNVMDRERLGVIVDKYKITQIYHLAAVLSGRAEGNPQFAWRLNMEGLLNVYELAREKNIAKVFWPSSIAVFGPRSPRKKTPQATVTDPVSAYGISKLAGERWSEYYHLRYGLDIRSVRFPGLISHETLPGGGTTDYAVDIFYQALSKGAYECFLSEDTVLPMMYMPDAIRAAMELMEAGQASIRLSEGYNIQAMSFSPAELGKEIKKHIPGFTLSCKPDFRQEIADNWPQSLDDSAAREDWGWNPYFDLEKTTEDMIIHIRKSISEALDRVIL